MCINHLSICTGVMIDERKKRKRCGVRGGKRKKGGRKSLRKREERPAKGIYAILLALVCSNTLKIYYYYL